MQDPSPLRGPGIPPPAHAAAAAINHLLRSASWARDALRRHAGKTARFEVFPFAVALTVLDSGEVAPAGPPATPHVTPNLRGDVEEALSGVLGDVAAHRRAETGRTLQRWGEQAVENTGRAFAEYWTEEKPLIAGARDVAEVG